MSRDAAAEGDVLLLWLAVAVCGGWCHDESGEVRCGGEVGEWGGEAYEEGEAVSEVIGEERAPSSVAEGSEGPAVS